MKRKKIGIAILLGMALCVSTAFTAVSVYGAEASETSDPSVNDNGTIITDIDSRYNENKQRGELIAYLGAEEMEFQIWQEGEYGFGGLRWSIWGDMNDSYTEISINKKLLRDAYQQTDVPVEVASRRSISTVSTILTASAPVLPTAMFTRPSRTAAPSSTTASTLRW